MSGLFGILGFNFDTTQFGDAQYLSAGAKRYLNAAPLFVSSWAQADIANNDVAITNYYKNPQDTVCSYITANAAAIYTFANTTEFINAANAVLIAAATNTILEVVKFKSHTDNVSGIVTMTSNQDTIPSLDSATSVGNYLLRVLSTTDGLSNTTPMLGSLTSLFINTQLTANSVMLYNDLLTLQGSLDINGNSTISLTEYNNIVANVNSVTSYTNLRRTSDWSFFTNARTMVMNSVNLGKFDNLGNTQSYLIENLIGTDRLKQNLANTSNTS
jgi:hypothetical protein